jgi:hypothetical protein
MSDDLRYLHTPSGLIPTSDRQIQKAAQELDMNQYAGMIGIPRPPVTTTLVDATVQMLAARVEGLEKDINGFQHMWGRIKALESEVARLSSAKIVPPDAAYNLLRRCLVELLPTSDLTGKVAEFLRNR